MKVKSDVGFFVFFALLALILFLTRPKIVFWEEVFFKVEAPLAAFRRTLTSRSTPIADQQREKALDQSELVSCREENQAMKKLLEAPSRSPRPLLPVRVFSQGNNLAVDAGRRDGLFFHQAVIAAGVLVGQVVQVGESTSQIRLLSDSQSELLVRLERDGHFLFTTHQKALVLDRLKQDEDVRVGDIVVAAGEDAWPPDLLIGQVSEVMPISAKVFRQAKVTPSVDYQALTSVFIWQ